MAMRLIIEPIVRAALFSMRRRAGSGQIESSYSL